MTFSRRALTSFVRTKLATPVILWKSLRFYVIWQAVKRSAAILFLSVFLLNIAGTYVYFLLRLQEIKAEMREALKSKPTQELDVLELTVAEFQSARVDEHEIKVNGKMYDLARVEKKGDCLLVYCLHDEAEDNLLTLLDSILKNASKDKKPVPGSALAQLLLSIPSYSSLRFSPAVTEVERNTPYRNSCSVAIRAILAPPPRG
jgi:hypothetical protein